MKKIGRWKLYKGDGHKKDVARLSHRGKPLGYVARYRWERLWRAGVCAGVTGFPGGKALGTFLRRCDAKLAVELELARVRA